jgi:predicted phosphate transport protein (TIGR00153 family)
VLSPTRDQGSSGSGRGPCSDLIDSPPAVARIRLTPQKHAFFELYAKASANAVEIARLLLELLESFPYDGDSLIARIKECEHEGDRLTHEVVLMLNRTFVTPFDRDDMYRLAGAIDDVCDHVDEAADNLGSWGVERVPDTARAQAEVIYKAATKLDEAVLRLEGFRDSSDQLAELRELEDEGDQLERDAVAELFANVEDAKVIIRWKDIHERLEEAVDALENAADVLEAIIVKNK